MFSWLKGGPKDRSESEFLEPLIIVFYIKRVNITSCGKRCQGSWGEEFSWIFQVSAKCSHPHPSNRDERRVSSTQWRDDVELEQRQRDSHKSGTPHPPGPGEARGRVAMWTPRRWIPGLQNGGRVLSSALTPQFTVTCYNSSP